MIQTKQQLNNFLLAIKDETQLAIDTEFKRTNTYYPVLCLLQIATKSNTDCIDILAFNDLTPLFDKLYQPDCLWIVHSARQDIEALYQHSKQLPTQLFDTQIAAALVAYPWQISYQRLTEILQGVCLEKAYTRLDWTTRPLPDEALEYALDDVRYLLKNYQQLHAQLQVEGKLDWIQEEGRALLKLSLYAPPINQAWHKIKGLSPSNKSAHTYAAQLAAWREYQAQTLNKPRQWIMKNDKLIACALGKDNLSDKAQQNFDNFICGHIELQSMQVKLSTDKPLNQIEKTQKQRLQKLIQQKAKQYNLSAEILVSGKSLLQYIRGNNEVTFCQGWRYDILKKELDNAK